MLRNPRVGRGSARDRNSKGLDLSKLSTNGSTPRRHDDPFDSVLLSDPFHFEGQRMTMGH